MARWTFTQKSLYGGVLRHVGDEIEASEQPPHTVASSLFEPYSDVVVRVPSPGGFVVRGEGGELVPAGKATRLKSRSPHELRPFAK